MGYAPVSTLVLLCLAAVPVIRLEPSPTGPERSFALVKVVGERAIFVMRGGKPVVVLMGADIDWPWVYQGAVPTPKENESIGIVRNRETGRRVSMHEHKELQRVLIKDQRHKRPPETQPAR